MGLRVVCYLNQFFGQLSGEEKAGVGPQVADGAVGAARAVQQALGDAGTVVATVICGDNYAAEQAERAVAEMVPLVAAARPDLVVAGPAFLAGRYGVACGALCAAVQAQLEVPVVTGMHAITEYEAILSRRFVEGVSSVPALRLFGIVDPDRVGERTPTFALRVGDQPPAASAAALADRGIYAWDGDYYALEVMRRLGLDRSGGALRIGFCHYATLEEVDRVIAELRAIA